MSGVLSRGIGSAMRATARPALRRGQQIRTIFYKNATDKTKWPSRVGKDWRYQGNKRRGRLFYFYTLAAFGSFGAALMADELSEVDEWPPTVPLLANTRFRPDRIQDYKFTSDPDWVVDPRYGKFDGKKTHPFADYWEEGRALRQEKKIKYYKTPFGVFEVYSGPNGLDVKTIKEEDIPAGTEDILA